MAGAVFFDRDGVLNDVVLRDGRFVSPRALDQLNVVSDAGVVADRLRRAGLRIFAVTNQPDIARGQLGEDVLAAMMRSVSTAVGLDDYRVCPHDDADGCACRKPRPGMITELAEVWRIELARSFVVGDSDRDVGAGAAAGCTTVLLRRPYNERVEADIVVDTLENAAAAILECAR
ncbi:MAG: D-glycero-alpha-D-manno-heptose-1,7-bisphosphate 7-phosphatase [Longimicrobiales bacterium]